MTKKTFLTLLPNFTRFLHGTEKSFLADTFANTIRFLKLIQHIFTKSKWFV